MTAVKVRTPHGEMPAYLATPAGQGPWPGVVVIHDALGMSTAVRREVDWLAGERYLAVAPDLYYCGGRVRGILSYIRNPERSLSDLKAARDWLRGQERCSGPLGVIGCSMGGDFALMLAAGCGFSAAGVICGGNVNAVADSLPDACPIVASFGGADRWPGIRRTPERLSSALAAAGIEHDIKVYPGAGHCFHLEHDPAELPLWAKALATLVAGRYHERSARDARRRIIDFFDAHLKS